LVSKPSERERLEGRRGDVAAGESDGHQVDAAPVGLLGRIDQPSSQDLAGLFEIAHREQDPAERLHPQSARNHRVKNASALIVFDNTDLARPFQLAAVYKTGTRIG